MQFFPNTSLARATWTATLLLATTACASMQTTLGSGVGDATLEHPPWVAGKEVAPTARVAALPVAYQRGVTQEPIFEPSETGAVTTLLASLNARLDSLASGVRLASPATDVANGSPDVQFSCVTENLVPDGDCLRTDGTLGRGRQPRRLAVTRGSETWRSWLGPALAGANADHALVVTLEIGQYLPRQVGLKGDKVIELGTDNRESLPWLTSLETPVQVLQLTGAIVDAEGKAVRIASEGLFARRTGLLLSAVGAQALITEHEVSAFMQRRREDAPGAPFAWQVALDALVRRLVPHAVGGTVSGR
ncbi:MAG: hypothetical protein H7066_09180 [Cytophagaceae bacterium]|nr:hypothetical protein [Gemmatimonadaceae bacterium]